MAKIFQPDKFILLNEIQNIRNPDVTIPTVINTDYLISINEVEDYNSTSKHSMFSLKLTFGTIFVDADGYFERAFGLNKFK